MNLKKIILIFILILLSLNITYSQYYADIKIYVENTGSITVSGTTNNILLQNITNSQDYTSKKGQYWLLNITTRDNFDNFIYELNLPENSQINYIKTTPTFRIEQDQNNLKLIGTGENKPLTIIVQYKINPTKKPIFSINNIIIILSLIAFLLLILIITIFVKMINKSKQINNHDNIINTLNTQSNNDSKLNNNKTKIDINNLPQRQQEIIKLLQINKKMTQKQIENNMNIPKSSVSRNVQALVQKSILIKDKAGQSNYITLNDTIQF